MLDHIQGILHSKNQDSITVSVGGIGLHISFPSIDMEQLPEIGQPVFVYTSLSLKDTSFLLFGFANEEKRSLFSALIQISGVGPKTALHLLSCMTVDQFLSYVAGGDAHAVSKVPGIGKKTAQRVILEMKDYAPAFKPAVSTQSNDAMNALIRLGYTQHKAQQALDRASSEQPSSSLEELITLSLKYL